MNDNKRINNNEFKSNKSFLIYTHAQYAMDIICVCVIVIQI